MIAVVTAIHAQGACTHSKFKKGVQADVQAAQGPLPASEAYRGPPCPCSHLSNLGCSCGCRELLLLLLAFLVHCVLVDRPLRLLQARDFHPLHWLQY